MRAGGGGGVDVDARRRAAHVARQIGANLLHDRPLGAGHDVAVDRLERAHDLLDFERAAERRGVGHAARGDQVLEERLGPVVERKVG